MKNVIIFSDRFTGIDWYFNSDKQTFIHPDKADLSDPAFVISGTEIPEYIAEIALIEFKCSLDYLETYGLGIREIE